MTKESLVAAFMVAALSLGAADGRSLSLDGTWTLCDGKGAHRVAAPVPGDTLDPNVEARVRKALNYEGKIEFITRDELYERAKKCFAIVQTGELAKYGNVFVKKGVGTFGVTLGGAAVYTYTGEFRLLEGTLITGSTKISIITHAPIRPSSSQTMAKIQSLWRSGRYKNF